jgi:hypothetical protein
MELPREQSRDAKEREALNWLIPTQGGWENPQDIQGHVLAHLALIGEKYSGSDKLKPDRNAQNSGVMQPRSETLPVG